MLLSIPTSEGLPTLHLSFASVHALFISILVIYCYVTKYHKLSVLKQY